MGRWASLNGMRTLIQNCETHLFLGPGFSWTPKASEAMVFENSARALEFSRSNRLRAVQIVLKFERDEFDVTLPITGSGCEPDPQRFER